MKVALRSEKLSDGTGIPCSYALELDDGRSILFQNQNDWPSLAGHLGFTGETDYPDPEEFADVTSFLDEHADDEWNPEDLPYPIDWYE